MTRTLTIFFATCLLVAGSFQSQAAISFSKEKESKLVERSATQFSDVDLSNYQNLSAEEFLALTPKEIKKNTGKKLRFKEKVALKIAQTTLKRNLKKAKKGKDVTGTKKMTFHIGGFLLGFFLGLIGVLIAYLVLEDKDAGKSSLIGLGAALVLIILLTVAVFSSVT